MALISLKTPLMFSLPKHNSRIIKANYLNTHPFIPAYTNSVSQNYVKTIIFVSIR